MTSYKVGYFVGSLSSKCQLWGRQLVPRFRS